MRTHCLVVTFVELIAPHTSVLTILAISFERYYAICQPLRAGYVCTKSRAMAISLFTWLCAGILTSPIIGLTNYGFVLDDPEPSCGPSVEDYWTKFYYMASFMLFFLIPCIILLVLYALIAQHLIREPARISNPSSAGVSSAALAATAIVAGENHALGGGSVNRQPRRRNRIQRHQNSNRARRQVVAMLGAVVVSFFVCLLPYRLLSLFQESEGISPEIFYMLVNFCRVMVYLNSAINPILYNLMSSKFRNGFLRLFGLKGFARQGTVTSSSMTNTNTTSTTASSSNAVAQANASLAHHGTLSLHRPLHYRLSINTQSIFCFMFHFDMIYTHVLHTSPSVLLGSSSNSPQPYNPFNMKAMYVVVLAFAALAAVEEIKGVAAEEPKKTVVAVEESKEIREVKALPAFAFAIPYGFGYAASAPYGYGYHSPTPHAYGYAPASFDATSAKFAATPFAFGAAPAKFAASPYGNAYAAAPYTYGYAALPYGYAAPAASSTAKLAAQVYAPYGAAKQYATYPYSAYHSPAFPYSYGYAASPYNFKFDGAKDGAATYQPENFPYAFPAYANAGFPFALKE
ncbi:putative Protein ETHR [Daphnia magna]|uniref:Thyrotropin-releasing hormone receptor n=2 Tax=Daphnia magna TaxID=35525 RepID=A0A162QQV9_9CRUS|nr:putative Protein ETHR [Daphnia magna]